LGRNAGSAAADYLAAGARYSNTRRQAVELIERVEGERYNDTNYIFPTYVVSQLPKGLAGLVIAVIFAAAMSSLSGEFNSLATATMVDFYRRFVRVAATDAHYLLVSRLMTAFWGGFACLVALQAGRLGSAIEVVNRFGSYFYGSILGVFALAVLTPRASARGAFYGLFVGMGAVALVSQATALHFLWYNVVGAGAVFGSGLLITALAPRGAERTD
jgi:Na+/proline symporter